MLTKREESLIREAVKAIIVEDGMASALANAFANKDRKSIVNAAQTCLKSGQPRAKCDDAINSYAEKTGDSDTAEKISAILDDPESWSHFQGQSDRERQIGRLNI